MDKIGLVAGNVCNIYGENENMREVLEAVLREIDDDMDSEEIRNICDGVSEGDDEYRDRLFGLVNSALVILERDGKRLRENLRESITPTEKKNLKAFIRKFWAAKNGEGHYTMKEADDFLNMLSNLDRKGADEVMGQYADFYRKAAFRYADEYRGSDVEKVDNEILAAERTKDYGPVEFLLKSLVDRFWDAKRKRERMSKDDLMDLHELLTRNPSSAEKVLGKYADYVRGETAWQLHEVESGNGGH